MDLDRDEEARGAAALFAASMLLVRKVDGSRQRRMAAALRFIDDLLERGWHYVDEPAGGDPAAGLFFSYDVAMNEETGGCHWLFCNSHPVEGTVSLARYIDEPDFDDIDPRAWFTFDQVDELTAVFDAVPHLEYKDQLPDVCYQYGAIVEFGDPFYAVTLSVDQVQTRRSGPQPLPAHEVLDAMREVYDTCPRCGTYTGGQEHSCN